MQSGDEGATFSYGTPLAPEQGMAGVCNAIGALVAKGNLPALKKARCQFLLQFFSHTKQ